MKKLVSLPPVRDQTKYLHEKVHALGYGHEIGSILIRMSKDYDRLGLALETGNDRDSTSCIWCRSHVTILDAMGLGAQDIIYATNNSEFHTSPQMAPKSQGCFYLFYDPSKMERTLFRDVDPVIEGMISKSGFRDPYMFNAREGNSLYDSLICAVEVESYPEPDEKTKAFVASTIKRID
jgi:hypothetical protein